MKKLISLFCVFFGFVLLAEAQQLTRFAVVDLPKVYMAFFRESRAVRDFEAQSARVQSEIDRMTAEIQNLRVNQVNAQAQGNNDQALRLETEINRRSDFLRDYYATRTAELERVKSRLTQSGSFLDQVYDEIRFIAESEGFSMVLNLSDNAGILWYSHTVDITDRLIQSLTSRARR
jgi:outer membrane protein